MNHPYRRTLISMLCISAAAGLTVNLPAAATENKPTQAAVAEQGASRYVRASKLIGMSVKNPKGEDLGEIKDLIVDVANERVYYAVLQFGGFLGLGEKLFAYPVRTFKTSADRDELVLNVAEAKLKAAPGFARDNWPDWMTYGSEVDRFHGQTVALKSQPGQRLRRASELIGKDVNDRNGNDVGEIEDIVVNMSNGRIHHAVLEFDRSWNLKDKLLVMPMRTITHRADRGDLIYGGDKAKLETARAFDKNRWPDLNDPRYVADVDRYLATAVTMAPTAGGTAAGKEASQDKNYRGFRASELIGKNVMSPEKKASGEIKDLVIHMSTGDVRYAIVSFGGFMGVGDDLFAIPVKSLKAAASGGDLILDMDKARVQQQKSFPRNKFPALKERQFWGEVDRVSGMPAVQPTDAYYAYRASELIGKDVNNVSGKDIGELKDLMIDMNTQKVHYAVVSFDPGILRSEKYFAFPVSSFMFKRDQADRTELKTGDLILNVEKSKLESMSGFDKNQWPNRTGVGVPGWGATSSPAPVRDRS